MDEDTSSLFHLKLIRQKTLSEQERNITNAFSSGMQPATLGTAAEAAHQLDGYCPPLEQAKEAKDYLWMVWEIMIDIAQSPDVTSVIHERLVSLLENLLLCAKGDLLVWGKEQRVWKDLPLLPMCMKASFNETEELTPESAQMWRQLNIFGARCLGAGVVGLYYQAMDALRSALEWEQSATREMDITECRIQVACAWISYGAKPLLWWAQQNIGYMDVPVEDTANYIEEGPLYNGPATMCLKPWGFWLNRFEELGKEESGMREETRKAALEAAETMKMVEGGVAHTLSA